MSAVADSSDGSSRSTSRIRFFSVPLEGGSVGGGGGGGGRGTVPDGRGPGPLSILLGQVLVEAECAPMTSLSKPFLLYAVRFVAPE